MVAEPRPALERVPSRASTVASEDSGSGSGSARRVATPRRKKRFGIFSRNNASPNGIGSDFGKRAAREAMPQFADAVKEVASKVEKASENVAAKVEKASENVAAAHGGTISELTDWAVVCFVFSLAHLSRGSIWEENPVLDYMVTWVGLMVSLCLCLCLYKKVLAPLLLA